MSTTYKQAGVDVEAGEALVHWLKKSEAKHKNVLEGVGGYAALFKANFGKMKKPLLVSCSDGVGTKVLLASRYDRYEGVGQDLVAMCVNDLICTGGEPLFFQDYFACAKLEMQQVQSFLSGVRKACEASDCVLIGGETAEMPGVYAEKDFDCAGFAVGVVDAKKTLGAHKVKAGDAIIGIHSNGFHSNGYSLLRRLFADDMDKWVDELLRPTHLYVGTAKLLNKKLKSLKALAHITGGGMDNIARVLPKGLGAQLSAWEIPDIFVEAKKRSEMSWPEMLSTLNCGVGMAVIVGAKEADKAIELIAKTGYTAVSIGTVQKMSSPWRIDGGFTV